MQDEIVQRIIAEMPDAEVNVMLDGDRALIEVVSARFADMTRVQKQQAVYACIQDFIADGRLHAVTIKANVPG